MISAAAALVTLVMTVPSTNAYVEGDSVFFCSGGAPTTDIAWIKFWRQDVIGGMSYLFDSLNVRGKEGQEVSIQVDPKAGTHIYAQVADTAWNYSCFSDGIYLPGFITGVTDSIMFRGPPVSIRWFGINGWVDKPRASGVYWKVETYSNGIKIRKWVRVR